MSDLWEMLSKPDAQQADSAVRQLLCQPGAAVSYFEQNLKPVPKLNPLVVQRFLPFLDSWKFTERGSTARRIWRMCASISPGGAKKTGEAALCGRVNVLNQSSRTFGTHLSMAAVASPGGAGSDWHCAIASNHP